MNPWLLIFLSVPVLVLGQGQHLSPKCSMAPIHGNCNGHDYGYYFNHTEGRCRFFAYSGCGGNGKIFQSRMECIHACTCKLPSRTGPCRARFRRYFFNSASGRCEEFYYGGCGGNENRFSSESECKQTCLCTQKKVVGLCRAALPSFYYNAQEGRCEPFIYGGCGGNANRFSSLESCKRECICSMDAAPGMCYAYFPKFFYNATTHRCQRFIYGGCMGNGNNFSDRQTCSQTCHGVIP